MLVFLSFIFKSYQLTLIWEIFMISGIIGCCLSIIQICKSWQSIKPAFRLVLLLLLLVLALCPGYAIYIFANSLMDS
ncbi:hypothetical protein D0T56_10740 [Dysgonomonas sp. 520]|nr:hypothetical protein [Dysgonomonas sp. 520]